MELGKHVDLNNGTGSADYAHPKHLTGIAMIPLGNRLRDVPQYGVDYIEERDSIDKYFQYLK